MAQSQRKGTPGRGSGNGVFYAVLGVIAVAGIIAIGYALLGGAGGSAATEPIDLQATDTRALYEQATPIRLGPDDAPVKIVEFGDFQCPGCGEFSLRHRPRVMPLVDSGLVQFIYYDYPLGGSHIHAFLAARAARCAGEQTLEGEDAYWAFHDKLYQEQARWSAERQVVDDFSGYAEEIGLDAREFERCVNSDRFADVVTANRLLGDELGVRGTPTILVNNRRIGGRTIGEMGDEMMEVVSQSLGTGDAGGP